MTSPRLARLLRELASVPPEELRRLADELDAPAPPKPSRPPRRRPPLEEVSPRAFERAKAAERRNGIRGPR